MRVYLCNLGCKLNQAEIDAMARRFQARGCEIVASLEDADLQVVNSCTVTHAAARDSRKAVRRAARQERDTKTVATGCWASERDSEARGLAGVDLVVPNDRKEDLVEIALEQFAGLSPAAAHPNGIPVSYVPLALGPTRGLVKVEDGCNMRCSFCIIPSTRGRQRSRPVREVVAEVAAMAAAGYEEVVVTGVQISSYRDGPRRLVDLVRALLDDTDVGRLRLTSIAPWDFDPRLLELLQHERLCRHVHLSLQSGCDATLRRMRRPYTSDDFRRLVAQLRSAVDGVAVTTDVIAGFPGEDEDEFAASRDFAEEMRFARTHVFGYSARRGTEAATLSGTVPDSERRSRVATLRRLGEESEHSFFEASLGSVAEVLWEEERGGEWRGMTDNYIRVVSSDDGAGRGLLAPARLVSIESGAMRARGCVLPTPIGASHGV